jgi:hypothetical protein
VVLVIGLFWLPGAFTDPPPGKTAAVENPGKDKDKKEGRAVEIGRKLARPVTLSLEPGPLKDALERKSWTCSGINTTYPFW